MKNTELVSELQREDPESKIIIWVEEKGYEVGDIYAGEPGEIEIQAGDEVEPL